MIKRIGVVVMALMLGLTVVASAFVASRVYADGYERDGYYEDDDRRGHVDEDERARYFGNEYRRHGEEENEAVPPVVNKTYRKECGACHFPYQPALLPESSWKGILGKLDDHYGDDASLDEATLGEIKAYVYANSADKMRNEISRKILKYERGATPSRISETRYFKKEHRKIKPKVLKRESIGSFANCIACHRSADRGVYEEDFIKIPRR